MNLNPTRLRFIFGTPKIKSWGVSFLSITLFLSSFSFAHAQGTAAQLSSLLQSELQLNSVTETQIQNFQNSQPAEFDQMFAFLNFIHTGDSLFGGKTKAQQELNDIANSTESQIPKNITDVTSGTTHDLILGYLSYAAESAGSEVGSSGVPVPLLGALNELTNGLTTAYTAVELVSAIDDQYTNDVVFWYTQKREACTQSDESACDQEAWNWFKTEDDWYKKNAVDCNVN